MGSIHKKVFILHESLNDMKTLNGWSKYNEQLWNSLTSSEKMSVTKILVEQLHNFLPHERMSFEYIVNLVRPNIEGTIDLIDNKVINNFIKKTYGDSIN